MVVEVVKDVLILTAILATVMLKSLTWLVAGQLLASVLTAAIVLFITSRRTGYGAWQMLKDALPFVWPTLVIAGVCMCITAAAFNPAITLGLQIVISVGVYWVWLRAIKAPELTDFIGALRKHF